MGWNLLEPQRVPEDSAGGFGVRNYTTGYPVQGPQWLEINKASYSADTKWLKVIMLVNYMVS